MDFYNYFVHDGKTGRAPKLRRAHVTVYLECQVWCELYQVWCALEVHIESTAVFTYIETYN